MTALRRPGGRRAATAPGLAAIARTAIARTAISAIALAAISLTAAACSRAPSGPQVAHLPGHGGASAAPGRYTSAQGDRDMIRFARCVRAHGVQIQDPYHRAGHSGLTLNFPAPTAANQPALDACKHFLQSLINFKQAGAASHAAHDLPALTAYARCMRAHDIPMLDPTPQGDLNLGRVPGVTGDYGRYTPQFRSADGACRHLLPADVHDNGTGP